MSQTRDQQRFTISEVAADWHGYESDTLPTGPLHPRGENVAVYTGDTGVVTCKPQKKRTKFGSPISSVQTFLRFC